MGMGSMMKLDRIHQAFMPKNDRTKSMTLDLVIEAKRHWFEDVCLF